jgi:hypothetical protein
MILLMAVMMGVMVLSMASAAWASASLNDHNCHSHVTNFIAADLGGFENPQNFYGRTFPDGTPVPDSYGPLTSGIAHSEPGAVGAGQRDLRDALANSSSCPL